MAAVSGLECQPHLTRRVQNLDLDAWREFHNWDTHSTRAAITVKFDPATQTCEYTVDGPLPVCPWIPEAAVDYHGKQRTKNTVAPGPFA